MSRLSTTSESQLNPETLEALEPARIKGVLAPVYLQFANSQAAIRAYLQMEKSLREGSLDAREIEAVKLWVSEHTGCDYCLAVHSYKASLVSLDLAMQLAIRQGDSCNDGRIDSLIEITAHLVKRPGILPEALLENARANGLTDENLVDLAMAISTIFFTNITNHINDTQITLPRAPALTHA